MSTLKVGVLKETAPGERRVALDPEAVKRVKAFAVASDDPSLNNGVEVLVETGAGAAAWFEDEAYRASGATITDAQTILAQSDVLLSVSKPAPGTVAALRSGQTFIGMLSPLTNPDLVKSLAERGVTAISLDGLPRTLSRAQGMDALSSQANVAGYRAVIVAAQHFDRFFPLLITAAGTSKPATVLVLGAGVAGLQAIGTARRLGALVSGYDVRPAAADEVKSLGAKFIELTTSIAAAGEGGYARELTAEERASQQAELSGHISRHDIVITTAQVPGRKPPLLVTEGAIAEMRPGSVLVDMGASDLGGNVAGSIPGETVVTPNGVTIVGATNLTSGMATSASQTFARNLSALLKHLIGPDGLLKIDLTDDIAQGVVVTHEGAVVHPATATAMGV